jgi:hypothetical protein
MKGHFTNYWNLALASVGRQLVAAASACADRGLGNHTSPVNIQKIGEMLEHVRPVLSSTDVYAAPDSGHKIQASDDHFRATLKWLQEEIRELLNNLHSDAPTAERKVILRILGLSAEDTAHHFGTLTEGWDRLVLVKHMLLLPDDMVLAKAAWLVSLMADFERSLRDAICLPIQCLGRLPQIMNAAADTVAELDIKLHPSTILSHERTDSAVAQVISESMAEGVTTTLGVTRFFAQHLGIENVEGNSFKRGFHTELKGLGAHSEDIILKLVELRRVALHDTTSVNARSTAGLHAIVKSKLGPLAKWDFGRLRVIAQFLYSYSIQYTLSIMDVVSRMVSGVLKNGSIASVARYKAASELRVGTLVLLKQKLWWLAWSLADHVRGYYEDRDGLMLRLNAAFAQSQISMPRDWRKDALQIDVVNKAPRYRLLKKCILGEWSGISPLIKEAITSGDMTLDELSSWPALEPLRAREEYNKAISEFGDR